MCCLWIIHHWVRDCNTLLWRARFLGKGPSLLQDVVDTPFAKLLKLPPPHVLSSDNELKNKNQKRRLLGHGLVWRGYTTLGYIPHKSNHLLRMVREPKYCAFGDFSHPNHYLRMWQKMPTGSGGWKLTQVRVFTRETWGSIWGAFEETCGLFDLQLPYEGPWGQLRWWRLTVNFAHFSIHFGDLFV